MQVRFHQAEFDDEILSLELSHNISSGNEDGTRELFLVAGTEATTPMFTIIANGPWRLPEWRKTGMLDRLRPLRVTEIEQDEERCLEAMLHWHDPTERLRTLRCRCSRHTLVDDNPASG
jgi:hypothetical protein